MVAVNIWASQYALGEWISFWRGTGAGDVLLAQDANETAVSNYQLMALGTEVIVDRQGLVVFRSEGAAGYEKLRSEIERVL